LVINIKIEIENYGTSYIGNQYYNWKLRHFVYW